MPRPYTLGKRAGPKAETRARIVAAAAAIYRDRGMAAATTAAIAQAADVAPATVRNHFPEPADLAGEVFTAALGELQPPSAAIFDGLESVDARIRTLALEMAAFYERSEAWWLAYQRDHELINAWSEGVDRYYRDIEELMRASLGPMSADETAVALLSAVVGPPTFFALRARGLSSADTAELSVALVVPWLLARLKASGSEPASS
jgi:AcrR family transcriptional regulator